MTPSGCSIAQAYDPVGPVGIKEHANQAPAFDLGGFDFHSAGLDRVDAHLGISPLAALEARLAPLQERRHALLVVFGQARERKLIEIHVAREIIKRVRQAIDGELRHRSRDLRLARKLRRQIHGRLERLAGIGNLLDQPPRMGFFG